MHINEQRGKATGGDEVHIDTVIQHPANGKIKFLTLSDFAYKCDYSSEFGIMQEN